MTLTASGAVAQVASAPDADGIYSPGKGLTPAEILNAPAAAYPADASLAGVKHVCSLNVVVGADGALGKIESKVDDTSPFEDGAIAGVKQSQFKPAVFQGHPVASRLTVWVPFVGGKTRPIPVSSVTHWGEMKYPVALNSLEAIYPKGASAQGVSLVSVVVGEDGTLRNPRIVRSLGPEFDENTLAAVNKYRFKPAMLYGVPMPVMIVIEVNFRKY